MNDKDNKFKYISKDLIGPHIIFSAAYMLLSANATMCTSRRESQLRNLSSAHNQVNASNRPKDLNRPKGDALGVKSRLDKGILDKEQRDEPFSTTTVVLPEQPVVKDRTIASSVATPLNAALSTPLLTNTSPSGPPSLPMPTEQLQQTENQETLNTTAPFPNQGGNDPISTSVTTPMPTGKLQQTEKQETLNTTAPLPNQGGNNLIT